MTKAKIKKLNKTVDIEIQLDLNKFLSFSLRN